MKTYKKIGLGMLPLLVLALLVLLPIKKALAVITVAQPADVSNATFTFVDRAHIKATFPDGTTVTYTDGKNDTNLDFGATFSTSTFCSTGSGINNTAADLQQYINGFDNSQVPQSGTEASKVHANITINVMVQATGAIAGQCQHVTEPIQIDNPNNAAGVLLEGSPNGVKYVFDSSGTEYQYVSSDGKVLGYSNNAGTCFGGSVVLLNTNATSGTLYILTTQNIGGMELASQDPGLANYFAGSNCYIASTLTSSINGVVGGTAPTTCDPNTDSNCTDCQYNPQLSTYTCTEPVQPAQTADTTSACEANAGTSVAWLLCPVESLASAIVQSTLNLFEGLLSFTGSDLGTPNCQLTNQTCQTGKSVWLTWSILKNIASIVLVVVMLVMVFSQAISFGPFDAYTVRKMLPRLVAAVILMQLSWPIAIWVVNLFNDLGKGLQDLLYAPFGGVNTLNSLPNLISHAGISTSANVTIDFLALLTIGVATIAALPTAIFLAVASLIGLLVAILTLVFRKILIILLVIFAPIALVAWTLPGTQRYWKLWSDNFIKVLAMYPLVVALIAGGRIFAYIAGPQTTGLDGFAARLLALLFVLVGFIGPLFILPKTFQWGGGIMSAATGAIQRMEGRLNKGIEQPLKGIGERWQGERAKQYNPEAGRGSRMLRRIQSGHILPTERSRRLTIASGDKWANERNDEAQALVQRTYEQAFSGGYIDGNGKKWDPGVGAAKQALVDMTGRQGSDADNRAAQAANKQLLDTSSWIEIQHSRITTGPNKGKRVSETGMFRTTLANSPQHYSATIGKRPDMAPDVIESAQKAAGFTYDQAYAEADPGKRQSMISAIDKARLTEALTRLGPENVPGMHQGLLEDIAEYGDRTGDSSLSNTLQERLQAFANSGSPAGANAIASLQGAEIARKADAALGHGYDEIDEKSGEPDPKKHLKAVAPGNLTLSAIAQTVSGRQTSDIAVTPPPKRVSVWTPETVRQTSPQIGGDAVQLNVEAPIDQGGAGGWHKLNDDEVVAIQEHGVGPAQARATEEMDRRTRPSP